MYLKSLEISGFKSFAGKASLSFTTPITSIVGPNGSGKSNVAEAFRFVLGEQSMKSMRGKRTEDLIWNGSRSTPKSNRASVKLRFDNTPHETEYGVKRLFDIDFDEVIVERVIHRDASSEYQLNGSPVRLKDIIELLAAAHIGASGHHIISQGEADRVLSVNSRERRAMIEDALGLKIYQYKKGFLHAKTMITDRKIAIVGSANLDIRSFDYNFEVNAIIYDKEIAHSLRDTFYDDLKDAEKIDAEAWHNRSVREKLLERGARLLSPLL
jgi:chromosome segregation protein